MERGHNRVLNNWKGVEGEVHCPHAMGTYIDNHYLHVASWWSWISHDTTLSNSWASSRWIFGPHTS